MVNENPKISIILSCLNEEQGPGLCLSRIKQVIKENNLGAEIIVVDNGSCDNSCQIDKSSQVKLVYEKRRGGVMGLLVVALGYSALINAASRRKKISEILRSFHSLRIVQRSPSRSKHQQFFGKRVVRTYGKRMAFLQAIVCKMSEPLSPTTRQKIAASEAKTLK